MAEAVAKTTGAVVQVHGAEAARRLELTTQVPTQSVFVTSGPSKRIRVGEMEIRLLHVCQRMIGAGMFIGAPPAFDAIVDRLRALENWTSPRKRRSSLTDNMLE